MIYILAGMAKSGKTLIANEILTTYKISYFSTDHIMMMLYYGNKELKIDINLSDISVSRSLEPYLQGLIEALIDSKRTYLIEGVHIQPDFAKSLQTKFPGLIKTLFLGYKDFDPLEKAKQLKAHAKTMENPWFNQMTDQALVDLTKYLQIESEKLYQTCLKYHQTYFEVNDILKMKDRIIDTLFF